MCDKRRFVRRVYVVLKTTTLSLESVCVDVLKNAPNVQELKRLEKKHFVQPTIDQINKLYVMPLDIPISVLY
jgi:hypothetical protein